MTKEQAVSYGTAGATGLGSWWAHMTMEAASWGLMEWLTAAGITTGILFGCLRGYYDLSAHLDRRRRIERSTRDPKRKEHQA